MEENIKKKLIAFTSQLLRQQGIRAVRMDDVAREMKMSKRTLYKVYQTKDKLVDTCLEAYAERMRNLLQLLQHSHPEPLAFLEECSKAFVQTLYRAERVFWTDIAEGYRSIYDTIRGRVNVDASEIDSPLDLQKAIKAIALCDLQGEGEMDAILSDWLRRIIGKSTFRKEQVEEERLKLELMKKDPSLKKAILEAEHTDFDSPYEKRGYFSGQIGFLLHMAKSENEYDIDRFGYCSKAVDSIFESDNYWRDYEKDYADIDEADMENEVRADECGFGSSLHRALLAYGDYSVLSPRSGVNTYFVYSETHHNYDWLGAFRKKDGAFPKAVDCLKSLLDEYWDNEGKNGFAFGSFAVWLNGFLKDTKLPESEAKDVQDRFRRRLYCKPNYFKYICRNYYVGVFDDQYELMRLKIRREGAIYIVPNLS